MELIIGIVLILLVAVAALMGLTGLIVLGYSDKAFMESNVRRLTLSQKPMAAVLYGMAVRYPLKTFVLGA